MIVVIVPGPYSPAAARAAVAAGRAVPPDAGVYGRVVLAGAGLADAPADGPGDADIPTIPLDEFLKADGVFLYAGLGQALGRALAGRPAGVALDGSGPAWMLIDGHGGRVGEVPQAVARVLYWERDRPVVVHFCPPPLYGHYAQEWARLVTHEPVGVPDPGHRLRFHHDYANRERFLHHPKSRARRVVLVKVRRVIDRFKFWRWLDRFKFWRV